MSINLTGTIQALNALADNLSKAVSIRDRVKLADRIFETLGQCEQMVEQFIVTELGTPSTNGDSNGKKRTQQVAEPDESTSLGKKPPLTLFDAPGARKYRGLKLADVGRILLKERGVLHGSEIEALAKAGGFKGKAVKFQSYLAVAFKRDGGFENLGRNRWKLKDSVPASSS